MIQAIENENQEKSDKITQLKNETKQQKEEIEIRKQENDKMEKINNGNELVIKEMEEEKVKSNKEITKLGI